LDHGGCSTARKTKNAQEFGFKAAIIIDEEAKDFYELRQKKAGENEEEKRLAYQLTIPYFKIFKQTG